MTTDSARREALSESGPAPESADAGERGLRPVLRMWTEVANDAQMLVRSETKLTRDEIGANVKSYAISIGLVAVGAGLAALAVVFLLVAAVVALAQLIGILWALLVLGGGCLLVAAVLILVARAILARTSLLPKKSIDRISTNISQMTARARLARQTTGDMRSNG